MKGASHETAPAPFPLHQSGKSALHPHPVGIAQEDCGNDGVHKIVEDFRAKFSLHEIGEALFLVGRSRMTKRLAENP